VGVFFGTGTASFKPFVNFPLFAGGATTCDLNNDGILDLVATVTAGGSPVVTYLGRGDGTFYQRRQFLSLNFPYDITCADLNKDGNNDLIIGVAGTTGFTTVFGNGDGTMQASSFFNNTPGVPTQQAVGDLNGDGYLDVVSSDNLANLFSTFLNNGSGGLYRRVDYTAQNCKHVELADLNTDGRLDMLCTSANNIIAFLGAGNGNFTLNSNTPTVLGPTGFAVADLNADGKLDLVVGGVTNNLLGFHAGSGDGNFAAPVTYGGVVSPSAVRVADINNDGLPDVIASNNSSSAQMLSLFVNNPASPGTLLSTPNLATAAAPFRLAMGKYSGDSLPLLAYTIPSLNGMEVRSSNGDTTFTAATSVAGLSNP
jgi:hypothetical protein